jgi:hypothetical protein
MDVVKQRVKILINRVRVRFNLLTNVFSNKLICLFEAYK